MFGVYLGLSVVCYAEEMYLICALWAFAAGHGLSVMISDHFIEKLAQTMEVVVRHSTALEQELERVKAERR